MLIKKVGDEISQAGFSKCGNYRLWLKKVISKRNRSLLYFGLNPSKANAYQDDPTIRRLVGFSLRWGYGELFVINLFSRVSSKTPLISKCTNPVGEGNDQQIVSSIMKWSEDSRWDLWLGWGRAGNTFGRNIEAISIIELHFKNRLNLFPYAKGPLCLGLTKNGNPRHPLYAHNSEKLMPFLLPKRSSKQ